MTSLLRSFHRWFGNVTLFSSIFGPFAPLFFNVPPAFHAEYFLVMPWCLSLYSIFSSVTTTLNPEHNKSLLFKKRYFFFSIALVFMSLYFFEIDNWTVTHPRDDSFRLQVGFGTADWSLSSLGRAEKEKRPFISPTLLVDREAGFNKETIELFWVPWTITLAGIVTWCTYFWAMIFATLAVPPLAFVEKPIAIIMVIVAWLRNKGIMSSKPK